MSTKWRALSILISLVGCSRPQVGYLPNHPPVQQVKPMDEPSPKLDVDVWNDSDKPLANIQDDLRAQNFKGIVIAGPDVVAIEKHDKIPFVGFRLHDSPEDAILSVDAMALVAVMRLESNEVFATTVFTQRDGAPPHKPAPPPRPAYVSRKFSFDLRERLEELPFRPQNLVTTVILGDKRSNRIRTRISNGVAEQDPAVVDFIGKNRDPAPPPETIFPPPATAAPKGGPQTFPVYTRLANSPEIPKEIGLNLAIERVVVCQPGESCVLRASFKLAALPREVVPPKPGTNTSSPGARPFVDVGDPRATAVVPVTLLLTGSEDVGPFLIRLRVPSYTPIDSQTARPVVEGYFNVDLFALDSMPQIPQTYQIWAFSGDVLHGPTALSIITKDMLRSD